MEEHLHNSGLDAPYWMLVFNELNLTLESFKAIDAKVLNSLLGKARSMEENKNIAIFIFLMKDQGYAGNDYPPLDKAKHVPAPDKPEGAPALDKPEGAPAPGTPKGAPSPDKPESAPAPDKPKGAPAPNKLEGTPALDKTEGAPAPDKPEGAPAPDKPEGAPALDKPEGASAPDKPEGTLDKPEGTPSLGRSEGSPAPDKPDSVPVPNIPGGVPALDKPEGTSNLNKPDTVNYKKSHSECNTPESMLLNIKEWHTDDLTVLEVQERLQFLLEMKKSVISETMNLLPWFHGYLAQPAVVQCLLAFVQTLKATSNDQTKVALKQLQNLIERKNVPEIIKECPRLECVTQWIYKPPIPPQISFALNEINDIHSFSFFLTTILENQRMSKKCILSEIDLASIVSDGVTKLKCCYQQTYNEIFIVVLISSNKNFDPEQKTFWSHLSLNDIKYLLNNIKQEKRFFEIDSSNHEALQAYLLFLAAKNTSLVKVVFDLMNSFQLHPKPNILSYFHQLLDNGSVSSIQRELKLHFVDEVSISPFIEEKTGPKKKITRKLLSCKYIENNERSFEAHDLLHKLNLCKYYPKRMKLKDVLKIKQEPLSISLNSGKCSPEQLPSVVLHKLMSYDQECRSDIISTPQVSLGKSESSSSVDRTTAIHPIDCLLAIFLCSDDFLLQDLFFRLAKCQFGIPFLITDPFSGQVIFPLWAMRSINKEWFLKKSIEGVLQQTHYIVKYPMKFVSFLRLGAQQQFGKSKSKILNQVISGSDHFFHYDLAGGQHPCVLGSGLIDMCWYFPSGKTTDIFPDAVTFLNLHGDARHFPRQCQSLSQVSSVCFAVVTENMFEIEKEILDELKSLSASPGGLTFLIATSEEPVILKTKFPNSIMISLKQTAAQIYGSIRSLIKNKLDSIDDKKSIESLQDTFHDYVKVDESNEFCVSGKYCANYIKDILKNNPNCKRDMILPLQGKSWKEWAYADKELYRVTQKGNLTVEKYVEKVKQRKAAIRCYQLQQLDRLPDLIQVFINSLRKVHGPGNFVKRNFFLQFLKLELNYLSQISISEKQQQFKLLRKDKEKLENNNLCQHHKAEKEKYTQICKELVSLQEDILESSFGLEHLLREIGQIYESAKSGKRNNDYSFLPQIVAELLIDGYPIEIMDGDAAHVPLQWVMDVLEETKRKLSNPKIFVFSVLGVQSTGKSTMLNTIFGLQFNVSAGRCTRGAFMQLLQLDDDLKEKTKCSYVLIVDTEGLRAPELNPLSMQKHDNELATFVIGLANMTLINIYGEVTGDIDDILQTSVHAFLRMSEVKNYPSCKFVHQNAGMNINCEVGRAKLNQKLNKFAAAAAKEEGKKDIKYFKEVIIFNDTEDVHYFPGLWKGDPPMAPINHGYSRAAQEMKQETISILLERRQNSKLKKMEGIISLSDFRTKVSDLWKSLLKENFVFSFRNTMERSYYSQLESAYNKWEWVFQESMIQWQQKAENVIKTEQLATLTQKSKLKLIELQEHIAIKYKAIKEEMDEYFEQNDILAQWKETFDRKLEDLTNELRREAETHCKRLEENRKIISEIEQQKERYIQLVTSKVQEHIKEKKREQEFLQENLAQKCLEHSQLSYLKERKLFETSKLVEYKDKKIIDQHDMDEITSIIQDYDNEITEEGLERILVDNILKIEQINKILESNKDEAELKHKFDEFWHECIAELPPSDPSSSGRVREEVERSLISHVGAKGNTQIVGLLTSQPLEKWDDANQNPNHEGAIAYAFKHVWSKSVAVIQKLFSSSKPEQPNLEAVMEELKDKVMNKVHQCINDFNKKETDFTPAYTSKLLKSVDKVIDSNQHLLSSLPATCRYELYCHSCSYAVKMFRLMADSFHERNDPRLYLTKSLKGPLFTKFKNTYQQIKAEEGISDTLCAYLEEPIRAQVNKLLSVEMVTLMKDSDHLFSNKMALKVKVLIDLHAEENFQSYMIYLRNVKKYLQDKLESYTIAFCDERSLGNSEYTRLQDVARNEVSRLIRVFKAIVNDLATDGIQSFLDDFNEKARVEIGATLSPKDVLSEYDALEGVNLANLKKNFLSQLENLEGKLHDSLNGIACKEEMKHWEKKPHELLHKLIGCTEQCPFCGEQCDLLQPDHDCDHRVEIHRVSCLKGYRWRDTEVMTTHFCQVSVSSDSLSFRVSGDKFHPYKDYKTIYPKWEITPDPSSEASLYWKWFVGQYYEQIGKAYDAKPADVPEQWFHIEWPEIEENLYSRYNFVRN